MVDLCHCGRPLHYTDPANEAFVRRLVANLGREVPVTVGTRTWLVSRHYIALHGIKAWELPSLGFRELFRCPHCTLMSHNPSDLANRYCGACHRFADEP